MATSRKKPTNDAERLAMRLPAELKEQVERAAALRGETVSGWAKPILAEAAARQLRDHDFLEMARADRVAFIQAVLSPSKPTKAAIEAARRYKKAFGV
ncbi:MAG: DUF1778 domain-containing protein [Candidatus Obscuribacterales bacterium]|jgi:uncharacterized protein (DUF1778 family)